MNTCILTTTISVPFLLREYAVNALAHGWYGVEFVIVGDQSTPGEVAGLCAAWQNEFPFQFTFFDVPRQEEYLSSHPRLARLLPWNSHQRRNVGLLYALERGHDFIITIDDHNHLIPGHDFIGEHISGLGVSGSQRMVNAPTGWFNCIAMMETNCGVVFPRGFPLSRRWRGNEWALSEEICRPVVNAGLWTGDPDIDALTRIYFPVETRLPLSHESLTLARGCWCPINTQNTALHRRAAPVAFMVVMGYEFSGLRISHYCDIWMSWLLRTVVDHMGDAVRYGQPAVHQQRNEDHTFQDLRDELPGMELNETLIAACQSAELTAVTYLDSYRQLARHLELSLADHPRSSFFRYLTEQMDAWAEAVELVCPAVQPAALPEMV